MEVLFKILCSIFIVNMIAMMAVIIHEYIENPLLKGEVFAKVTMFNICMAAVFLLSGMLGQLWR